MAVDSWIMGKGDFGETPMPAHQNCQNTPQMQNIGTEKGQLKSSLNELTAIRWHQKPEAESCTQAHDFR